MSAPCILFGAFDRHNLGDLLFPHVVAALRPGAAWRFAGLAARDLRPVGGHDVEAMADVAAAWGHGPATVLHVGGEILTCTAWQAAAMLLPPLEAPAAIPYLAQDPDERDRWVQKVLRTEEPVPYAAGQAFFPLPMRGAYLAAGGVALHRLPADARARVLGHLRRAAHVSVRDEVTQAHLAAAGIHAPLLPDAAILVADLFGARIRACASQGPVGDLRQHTFPQGYLAVQCSAEFDDDRTLDDLAAALGQAVRQTGLGLALLRAGAAPWHDDLATLQRLAARLPAGCATVVESLDVWTLCALIAASEGFVGSSLHGRIVAMAFELPRVTVASPASSGSEGGHIGKHDAFARTWEPADMPRVVAPAAVAQALGAGLRVPRARLHEQARQLATRFQAQAGPWLDAALGLAL